MVANGKGQYYWIIKSVSTMQNAYAHMHDELQNTAIINTLYMDQVEEDFGPDPIDPNDIWDILSGAFGFASTVSGPASASLGALSSALGLVSTFDDPGEADDIDLNEGIRLWFESSDDALQGTINRALGFDDMNKLPASSLTGDYETAVARFFADGKYLIDNISNHFNNIFDEARVRSVRMRLPYLEKES
jgi:hypothetical protein